MCRARPPPAPRPPGSRHDRDLPAGVRVAGAGGPAPGPVGPVSWLPSSVGAAGTLWGSCGKVHRSLCYSRGEWWEREGAMAVLTVGWRPARGASGCVLPPPPSLMGAGRRHARVT